MTKLSQYESHSEFKRTEFADFIRSVTRFQGRTEEEDAKVLGRFIELCPHPAKSDLIYWPEDGADDSPEGIVAEIERYCRDNGLPGFKDSGFQSALARISAPADKLRGQRFATFDDFREAFWKEVAADPALAGQFSRQNAIRMADGLAPFAPPHAQVGDRSRFELDHIEPLFRSGEVYNVENLQIMTPADHIEKTRND